MTFKNSSDPKHAYRNLQVYVTSRNNIIRNFMYCQESSLYLHFKSAMLKTVLVGLALATVNCADIPCTSRSSTCVKKISFY